MQGVQRKKLFIFGSILNRKFNKQSDVDFIVDFKKISVNNYADNYFNLKYALEEKLARHIDLLEMKSLNNPYFLKSIEKYKLQIYG